MLSDVESSTEYREFLKFCGRRILRAIAVMIGVTLIVFVIFEMWGIDRPVWEQYLIFLQELIFEGDLGTSWDSGNLVADEIGQRLPASIELALVALIFAIMIGVPIGIISAYFHRRAIDHVSITISYLGMSLPPFWFGLILMRIFASDDLGWFETSQRIAGGLSGELTVVTNFYLLDSFLMGLIQQRWEFFFSTIGQLILPAITLGVIIQAIIAKTVRSLMLTEFKKDYVRTARSKGLKEQLVVINHATKNSMIPTLTIVGLLFGTLTVGSVLVEKVFTWPGLGSKLIEAIGSRDYPLVMGGVLVTSIIFILINTLTDIIYMLIDPRIRFQGRT